MRISDRKFMVGVKALITNSKGEVLVLRAVPHRPSQKFKPYWDLPGGKMNNDDIRGTLFREVEEETGIGGFSIGNLIGVTVSNIKLNDGKNGLLYVVYGCRLGSDSRIILSKEHSEYRWVNRNEAMAMLQDIFPRDFLERIGNDF